MAASDQCRCPDEAYGALAEADEALREHAAACPDCRRRLEFIETLKDALAADRAALEPPAGLAERIVTAAHVTPQTFSRRISERYERRAARRHAGAFSYLRRYWPAYAASAAAALLFCAISVFWYVTGPRADRMYRAVYTSAEARREQRAAAKPRWVLVSGGVADVSNILPDGEVYLVGQSDEALGEVCIFAYADGQWRLLEERVGRLDDAVLTAAWEQMKEAARHVSIEQGALAIPEKLWREYLRGSERVAVLSFKDRSELWDCLTLDEYRRPTVVIDG